MTYDSQLFTVFMLLAMFSIPELQAFEEINEMRRTFSDLLESKISRMWPNAEVSKSRIAESLAATKRLSIHAQKLTLLDMDVVTL